MVEKELYDRTTYTFDNGSTCGTSLIHIRTFSIITENQTQRISSSLFSSSGEKHSVKSLRIIEDY